ncbi:MAG TPA: allantoinase AllB [Solirubrobacteraceae bacterium]|nr:allantoinase AllB [Solirubrobacteraceae bacterium]
MSEFELVIRGGRVVLADGPVRLDVGVSDGLIAGLGRELAGGGEEIDAAGLHVLPGAVDAHVHVNEPGRTEWEGVATGSAALAVGGTTTALEMPLNAIPATVDAASWQAKIAAWEGRTRVDFALWGGIVPDNEDGLVEVAELGAVGFKAFMCEGGTPDFQWVDDARLHAGMCVAARRGLPVAVHAENDSITAAGRRVLAARTGRSAADYLASRPALAEIEAVSRALTLAQDAGCRVHLVHLSTGRAVALVHEARVRGVDATCETCPHYLAFTVEDVERIGTIAKCAPPIRGADEQAELWAAVIDGRIDMVSTDHAPAPLTSKGGDFLEAWGGIAGGQMLTSVLLSEGHHRRGVPLARIARLLAGAPAERFGLERKGRIEVGADADLVLVNLADERTVTVEEQRCRHPGTSPYVDMRVRGRPVRTLLRGATVARDGEVFGPARGRFVGPVAGRPAPAAGVVRSI